MPHNLSLSVTVARQRNSHRLAQAALVEATCVYYGQLMICPITLLALNFSITSCDHRCALVNITPGGRYNLRAISRGAMTTASEHILVSDQYYWYPYEFHDYYRTPSLATALSTIFFT